MKNVAVGSLLLLVLATVWWFGRGGASPMPLGELGVTPPRLQTEEAGPSIDASKLGPAPVRKPVGGEAVVEPAMRPEAQFVEPRVGIFGQVRRSGGETYAGRSVNLVVLADGKQDSIAATRTGPDGNYAFEFSLSQLGSSAREMRDKHFAAWLQGLGKGGGRAGRNQRVVQALSQNPLPVMEPLWLEVSVEDEEGFRASKRIELRRQLPARLRVDLIVKRIRALEGEVLGPGGGEPLADILLLDGDWNVIGTTRSDRQGRFQMTAPPAGYYVLHARKPGAGTGQVSGNYIGAPFRAPDQKLVLEGSAGLYGLVVTSDGEPFVGLPVTATESTLAQTCARPGWPESGELAAAEGGRGLALSRTLTDLDGRFLMAAMQEGSYQLHLEGIQEEYQPPGVYQTGTEHRITFRGSLLTVEVLADASDLLDIQVHCIDADWKKLPAGVPISHLVKRTNGGIVQFVLEPENNWLVFAEVNGKRGRVKRANFGPGVHSKHLFLNIWATSTLRTLMEPDMPVAGELASLGIKLQLGEEETGAWLLTLWRHFGSGKREVLSHRRPPKDGIHRALEAGNYEYLVESSSSGEMFLPLRGAFSLSPGQSRRLELSAQVAGRLRLELSSPEIAEGVRFTAGVVTLSTDGERGAELLPLSFTWSQPEPGASGFLKAGQSVQCSPLLAPGRYELTLIASRNTIQVPPLAIEIRPGEELLARIDLPEQE